MNVSKMQIEWSSRWLWNADQRRDLDFLRFVALTGAIMCMGVAMANSILVVSFCP